MKKTLYYMMAALILGTSSIALTSCEDVPEPYAIPTADGGGSDDKGGGDESGYTGAGTLANPYTAKDANTYTSKLAAGVNSDSAIYIKGIIVSYKEEYNTNYGNGTFYISDDGTSTNQFYVYRALYLGNKKFTSSDKAPVVGDTVVVYGKVVNYSGNTPETVQGETYLYSVNGKTSGGDTPVTPSGEATGDGTLASPYNCVKANQVGAALSSSDQTDNVYIKGKVVSVTEAYNTNYGNATFYISDDGTSTNQFYVFRALYLGNVKYTSGTQPKAGDEVVIYGKICNYYGNTVETVQNAAYLYSLNGKTTDEGGSEEKPDTPSEGDATITKDGTTVTLTGSTTETTSITCTLTETGQTDKADPVAVTLSDGTTISWAQNGGNNAPKYYASTKGVRMYALNSMTIAGAKKIAKVVMTCDVYNGTQYVGNDEMYVTVSGNTWTIVNHLSSGNSGGTQLRPQTITITYAE